MSEFEYSDHLKKILKKLYRKDRVLYDSLMKKIGEVVNSLDPNHYKNLRYKMKDSKRIHIGHFVLIFQVKGKKIFFDDFDHHDNIY